MSLLEEMEKVEPKERIILTYDAWRKIMNEVSRLQALWNYLKLWAGQPPADLTEKQVMAAVVRMCDDALGGN